MYAISYCEAFNDFVVRYYSHCPSYAKQCELDLAAKHINSLLFDVIQKGLSMDMPTLNTTLRTEKGSKAAKKLRLGNKNIPGVLYGKKQENLLLYAKEEDIRKLLDKQQHIVELKLEGIQSKQKEFAMFKDLQWDIYGEYLQHFDLVRVSLTDRVQANIPIEIKGSDESKGLKAGGFIEKLKNTVELECPANDIPQSIKVDISNLDINGKISFGELLISSNYKLLGDPTDLILVCHPPKAEEEITADAALKEASQKEPEVLKEKEKEKEEPKE